MNERAMELAQLHSDAVDYPKSGILVTVHSTLFAKKYPDFLEKDHAPMYKSMKATGEIYRSIVLETFDGLIPYPEFPLDEFIVPGSELFLKEAPEVCLSYAHELYGIMKQFDINNNHFIKDTAFRVNTS